MIVVINPSGSAGQSFKGLHAYCAHDQERAQTSERVEWVESRNIAANDPDQAWKIMAATAYAQNDIKRAAGIRAGKAPKDGAVLHVVLSFDEDEPTDRETVEAAADEFLSKLGVDPAKMRSKNKPSRRQFADEHQVVMYAHKDTDNTHVHLMINRVHPETGIVLPSNNDQLKAQKWALAFTKRHGTDHKTPEREENAEARANGEYVKGNRRKTRNAFEKDREIAKRASNDNERSKAIVERQRQKDAALALRGRNMAKMHATARDQLIAAHRSRKASIAREVQQRINRAKAITREEYRPKLRDLRTEQESEKATFAELEKSFFGRTANAAKLSAELVREQRSKVITRTFRILTNAAERKAYLKAAQERARNALQRQQADKVRKATNQLKGDQQAKYEANRAVLAQERIKLDQRQQAERDQLKADWQTRTKERQTSLDAIPAQLQAKARIITPQEIARLRSLEDQRRIEQGRSQEQDNKPPAPPTHKIDFDKARAAVRAMKQRGQGQSPADDDDMDI